MRLYVLDNIDSFTYNLVHLCHQVAMDMRIPLQIEVGRIDSVSLKTIEDSKPDWLLISPGPGHPKDATLSLAALNAFTGKIPVFGVCLGMQVMAYAAGLSVEKGQPVHGKKYSVYPTQLKHPLFKNMPYPFDVIRYHSLHVPQSCISQNAHIQTLACCDDIEKTVMAIEVQTENPHAFVWGVQFHPESIGTANGLQLMTNVFQAVIDGMAHADVSVAGKTGAAC